MTTAVFPAIGPVAANDLAIGRPMIGSGAFCAFWGGPGFGAMIGGLLWSVGQERVEREHRSQTGSRR